MSLNEITSRITMVMTVRIPKESVADFLEYEEKVLPLLAQHKGTLERRLSNDDGTIEVHILSFESEQAFEDYCYDPKRLEYTSIFDKSGAQTELMHLTDVV